MSKHKISLRLGETHYKMLCAVAEYEEESLAAIASIALREWLEVRYKQARQNSHIPLLAKFDQQLGIAGSLPLQPIVTRSLPNQQL